MNRRSLLALASLSIFACGDPAARMAADSSPTDAYLVQQQRGASAPRAFAALGSPVVVTDAVFPMPTATNMVIRNANAAIKVDSLELAIAALREVAARVGGFVANAGIQTGRGQLRSATIEVKVPAARFDEALAGLKPIGELEAADVKADDVGEEFVDVSARMENARRLERRLIELLATRTGKLKDVLDVEQSLAHVREEIERYEGRLRYLRAHTAMSTLTVYVHEPLPVVGSAGRSVMGEAFRQAWRNFVMFLAVFVQALGIVIPLGAIAAAVWLVVRARARASSRAAA